MLQFPVRICLTKRIRMIWIKTEPLRFELPVVLTLLCIFFPFKESCCYSRQRDMLLLDFLQRKGQHWWAAIRILCIVSSKLKSGCLFWLFPLIQQSKLTKRGSTGTVPQYQDVSSHSSAQMKFQTHFNLIQGALIQYNVGVACISWELEVSGSLWLYLFFLPRYHTSVAHPSLKIQEKLKILVHRVCHATSCPALAILWQCTDSSLCCTLHCPVFVLFFCHSPYSRIAKVASRPIKSLPFDSRSVSQLRRVIQAFTLRLGLIKNWCFSHMWCEHGVSNST